MDRTPTIKSIVTKLDALMGDADELRRDHVELAQKNERLTKALSTSRAWVAQYLDVPGHDAAAQAMLAVIDCALKD